MTSKSEHSKQKDSGSRKYQPPKKVAVKHRKFISKVGQKVKSIREKKLMTHSQLSAKARVSRTLIYKIEEGKAYFTISTLLQVLDALEIEPSDFFKGL